MNRIAAALVVLVSVGIAACSDGGTRPEPTHGPLLQARVVAVGEGSTHGLWAVWKEAGTTVDSAAVGADGSFSLHASSADAEGEILIDGPDPRAFHPILFPLGADSLDGIELLLIPREWRIRKGTYQGQMVATSLDLAVEDDADRYYYSYFFGQPQPRDAPERFLLELMTWPAENLPARVAIDHAASGVTVTPADSAEIWGVLNDIETATGEDLFQPVRAGPSWWAEPDDPGAEPFEPGVIRVVREPGRWRGLPQSRDPERVSEGGLEGWARGGRFEAFRERHVRLNGGLLLIDEKRPLQLADGLIPWRTVVIHETLHILGLGHTCRIPSPMGPCVRTRDVSPFDVAYMELLREVVRLAHDLDVPLGLMPSIVGERRILLGLSALPELDG